MQIVNNRYKIEDTYRETDDSNIYKVTDLWNENKTLFLKIIKKDNQNRDVITEISDKFLELTSLKHKFLISNQRFGIVKSIDNKLVKQNQYFYTKDYYDGVKLSDLFGKLKLEEILDIVIKLLELVNYIHFRGYVYKYITPDKIYISQKEDGLVVKLLDFAEVIVSKSNKLHNEVHNFYLAPEVRFNQNDIDYSADTYSIAMIFYSLMCCRHKEFISNYIKNNFSFITDEQKYKFYTLLEKMTKKNSKLRLFYPSEITKEINNIFKTDYKLNVKDERSELNFKTKLIGREKEVGLIKNINAKFDNRQYETNLVLISGEEGIGKTRLLEELEYRLKINGKTVHFTSISENDTKELTPIIRILRLMIQNCNTNLIEKYGHELVKILPEISSIKDIKPSPILSGDREKLRLYDRISNFIIDYIDNKPMYIMIDGFENSDIETINLINYIIDNNKSFPLLMILTINNDTVYEDFRFKTIMNKWLSQKCVERINLFRFNFEESTEMIKNILGMSYKPIKFSTRIIEDTLGNPRHIEEVLKSLKLNGELFINDNGNWDTKTEVYTNISIPENVDEAIKRQIDLLDKELINIAKYISIFKTSVSKSIIEKITQDKNHNISDLVDKLVSMKILEERVEDWGHTYDFYNKQLKMHIYRSIDEDTRVKLHRKAAEILEKVYLEQKRGNTEELIFHYNLCNQADKAIAQAIASAKNMKDLVGEAQLISLWESAYNLLKNRSDMEKERLEILYNLGNLYTIQGMNKKALDYYNDLLLYARKTNEVKYEVLSLNGTAYILFRNKNIEKSKEYLAKAKKIAEENNYIEGILESIRILTRIKIALGEYHKTIEILERYLPLALDNNLLFHVGFFYNNIGICSAFTEQIELAKDCFEKSINFFIKSGNHKDATKPINNLGAIYSDYFADLNVAMIYYQQGLEICHKYYSYENEANFLINIAELYIKNDQYERAREYAEKAEIVVRKIDEKSLLFYIQINLANIYLNLGEYDKCFKYHEQVKNEYESSFIEEQYITVYHDYMGEFCYNFGFFDEALEHNLKIREKGALLDKKLELIAETRIIIQKYKINGQLNKDDMEKISSIYRKSNAYGNRRRHLLMCAFEALDAGDIEYANRLLSEDEELSILYTSNYIDGLRSYLKYSISKNVDGLIELLKSLRKNHFAGLEYYTLITLGDIYFDREEYYNSVNYYLEGLDLLYVLAKKIPDINVQVSYIRKYFGHVVKRKINIITSIFKGNKADESIKEDEFSVAMKLEDYFDFANVVDLFNDEAFISENKNSLKSEVDYIDTMDELLSLFTSNYKSNLELILNYIVKKSYADNAAIFTYDEELNKIETFISTSENISTENKSKIISEVMQNGTGLLINRTLKNENCGMFMLLPDDVKALMCVPIIKRQNENLCLEGVNRRKAKHKQNETTIGFIYLETDKLFNRFDIKNLRLVENLTFSVFLNLDNYNLKIASSMDKMTGVYNREYFDTVFKEILNKAMKEDSCFTLAMVDVDKFKDVNDTFGHQKGDEILSKLGGIILDNVRETDIVGRYGGEEFIILLLNACEEDGKIVADKIRKKVEESILVGEDYPLTISMGLSVFPKHAATVEELIEKADQALYKAKENGRNNSVIWSNNIGNRKKRLDKLVGIVSGNTVQDQRNVLAMVEVINLISQAFPKEEKIFRILGRIIEIIEGEQGILFTFDGKTIDKVYARKRFIDKWIENPKYNKKIIIKTIEEKSGEFLIDWEDIKEIDVVTGKPNWQSMIVVPLIYDGDIKGVLQISVPIKEKEFDYNNFNYVNTLSDIIAAIL